MKTFIEATIRSGIKVNSMYQPNSVTCMASKEEMEQFYEDTEGLCPKLVVDKPNAMKIYSVEVVKRRASSLVMELD